MRNCGIKGFNYAKAKTRQSGSLGHRAGLHEHEFSYDPPKATACGSANGKVKRRRRDGGNGDAAERPSRNRRRKLADHSASRNAARDERAFLRNGTGAVVRGFGRTAAVEVEQESALVTAEPVLFSNQASGFSHERMLKGTGIGVERGSFEA
jgi:hypothetical protein